MKPFFSLIFLLISTFNYAQQTTIDSINNYKKLNSEGLTLIHKGKYLSSIKKFKVAILKLPKSKLEEKIKLNYSIGFAYQISRAIDSAEYYYNKGDNLIHDSISASIKSRQFHNKASLSYTRLQIDSAMVFALKALGYAMLSNDKKQQMITHSNIGLIFLNQKNYSKADTYLKKTHHIAQQSKDSLQIAKSLMYLGQLHIEKKDYDLAISKMNEALLTFESKGFNKGVLISKSSLAKIFLLQGKTQQAIKLSVEIMSLLKEFEFSNDAKKLVENTTKIAELSINKNSNNIKEAQKLIEENIKTSINSYSKLEQNKAVIAYIEQREKATDFQAKPEKAILNLDDKLKTTLHLQDSIYQASLKSKIQDIETKYETQKKDNTILKQKSEIQEQELNLQKKQQKLLLSLIALMVVFILFLIYAVRKLQKKIKTRKLLEAFSLGFSNYLINKYNLSENELLLWIKITERLNEKEQADQFFKSINTIKTWRKALYSKLNKIQPVSGSYRQKHAVSLYNKEAELFKNQPKTE